MNIKFTRNTIDSILKRILLFLVVFSVFSCKESTKEEYITVSILPVQDLVQQITGDSIKMNVLIPAGASHGSADFTVDQLKKVKQSRICFTIGNMGFEQEQLVPMLKESKTTRLVALNDGMSLVESSCDCGAHDHVEGISTDPHLWMAPMLTLKMFDRIYANLIEVYPDRQAQFEPQWLAYRQKILDLDTYAKEKLADKAGKSFIIYHPALTYFASEYGLNQLVMENEGKLPSPTHLRQIIDNAKKNGVKLIFIQKQYDKQTAQSIADEVGAEVIQIDPLTDNWMEEMYRIVDVMNEKL